jgi:hypothetical protein
MSSLAYTRENDVAPNPAAADRKGLWRRILDAVIASQQRRAEREIAHYLQRHGGVLTDDREREIMHRL